MHIGASKEYSWVSVGGAIAQVTLWRQAQEGMSILALRSVELEGLEGIIIVFDLGQVRGEQASLIDQRHATHITRQAISAAGPFPWGRGGRDCWKRNVLNSTFRNIPVESYMFFFSGCAPECL